MEENKDNQLGVKSVAYTVKEELSQETKNMLEKLNNQEKLINYRKLNFRGGNDVDYNFSEYKSLKELFKAIYYRNVTIEEAERTQEEFDTTISALKLYPAIKPKYTEGKTELLINAKTFYDGRETIINAFRNKIFPMTPSGFSSDDDISPRMSPDEDESPNETHYDELYKAISNVDNKLDSELIRKYFNKGSLLELSKFLRYSQNKAIDAAKQGLIEVNLSDLKNNIKNMSDDEVKNKNLDIIAYFVEKILNTIKTINNQEEQQEKGLKIMTPKQLITRLPILLAQLKAGNNSEKLKNKIRQILYSLYR